MKYILQLLLVRIHFDIKYLHYINVIPILIWLLNLIKYIY